MRIIFVFVLQCLTTFCFAQTYIPGYIIKNNGDSIQVELKDRLPLPCFQGALVKENGKIQEYTAHDLQAYSIYGSKRFEVFEIDSAKVFLKVLVGGKLSFYQGLRFYYVKEKEKELVRLYNFQPNESEYYPSFITTLNSIVEETGLRSDHINYTEKEISNLVSAYNQWQEGNPGIEFKKQYPGKVFHFTAKLGVTSSLLNPFESRQDWEFDNPDLSQAFTIGVGMDFSSPKRIKRLYGTLEAYFEKNAYEFRLPEKKVELDMIYMKLPLGLRYHIFLRDNTPFLGVGYLPMLAITSQQYVHRTEKQTPWFMVIEDIGNKTWFQSGLFATAGYQQVLYNKMKFTFEIRYAKTTGHVGGPVDSQIYSSELNLLLGFRY